MPLHEWSNRDGWAEDHTFWMVELCRNVRRLLPGGYRAHVETMPIVTADDVSSRPDIAVTEPQSALPPVLSDSALALDLEVAIGELEGEPGIFIKRSGQVVAAIEIISPRNKDRPDGRANYGLHYVDFLRRSVHLLLIDVHRRPVGFSFGQSIAAEFAAPLLDAPAPVAVSYRVGEPAATGGKLLGMWQRPLTVGEPLPTIPLAISLDEFITIDLEPSYRQAALDGYVE